MRIGWLDGYEHNQTVNMDVTNTKVQSNARTPMNVHHLELFYYVAKRGGISGIPYGIQQPAVVARWPARVQPRSCLYAQIELY